MGLEQGTHLWHVNCQEDGTNIICQQKASAHKRHIFYTMAYRQGCNIVPKYI